MAGEIVSNRSNIAVKIGGRTRSVRDINDTNITHVTTPSACPLLHNCDVIHGSLCMQIHPTNYAYRFHRD